MRFIRRPAYALLLSAALTSSLAAQQVEPALGFESASHATLAPANAAGAVSPLYDRKGLVTVTPEPTTYACSGCFKASHRVLGWSASFNRSDKDAIRNQSPTYRRSRLGSHPMAFT